MKTKPGGLAARLLLDFHCRDKELNDGKRVGKRNGGFCGKVLDIPLNLCMGSMSSHGEKYGR